MDRREARRALRLAEEWHRDGLVPDAALDRIRARYAAAAEAPAGESFGASVLYGLGGVLLGAAVLALWVLLVDNGVLTDSRYSADGRDIIEGNAERVAPWMFLGWGALCAAVAFAVDRVARRPGLGDAFHVAALFAVTAAAFPQAEEWPVWAVSMAWALAILAYRRQRVMVSLAGLAAFNVAACAFLFGFVGENPSEETAATLWFALAAVQAAALAVLSRRARLPWTPAALGLATLLLAATFLAFYFENVESQAGSFRGDAEVYVAALMGAAMAAGLALREKGMVVSSALVIAIDAIVFAFDVGEILGGLVAILAVAGLLIWQAGSLRRYLRDE